MTQSGGPAAINGFLYQIIHHLGWLADVTFSGKLDGETIEDACLVLEPRSGGDARAEASGVYLVEQYKTRKNGTWALSDIQSVLGDLRKAVQPSRPMMARYRFVTDGRAGRLDTFRAFLTDLESAQGPCDLDNIERKSFGSDFVGTDREFFDHIVIATRSGASPPNVSEHAVVFHLLSCFEMEFGVDASARADTVERLLRRYAPDLGDERKIREHLVGVLVETLSKGETRLDAAGIDALFRRVGLNPQRLRNLAVLAETMSALTRRRLVRLKYQRGRDIRVVPTWPADKPVLLIAGESGAGKTWQLGRLLESCGEARQVSTLLHAVRTRADLLEQAASDLWQVGLGETSEKSLVAVSRFLRELAPNTVGPRMVVALDDVQDIDLARDLVRLDWADWDMRLALTVPYTVARAVQLTDGELVHVHSVGDFSVDELDALLQQSGRRWADLPSDLKRILRNPILAGLFLELPYASVQTAPRSEYEIFEGFWQRIAAKGRPGDEGVVIALAAHMSQGKSYPLPRQAWHEIGLDGPDALSRLEAAGWLRSTEFGEVAFAHDRLLNWAVAKSLVLQFQRKELSIEDLGAFLTGKSSSERPSIRRILIYVPMDALWLLAAEAPVSESLGQLVAQLEESREFGSYGEDLYTHLLPTLGQRAVPVLLARLDAIVTASEGDYRVNLIGKAFANLAQQEHIDLRTTIASLLNASSRDRQKVAITALTTVPDIHRLDRLWQLHQQRLDALEDKSDHRRHNEYQASFAALRSGVALYPEWLRGSILATDASSERVSELGYLLNGLDHPDAFTIWNEINATLMAKVPSNKPRSLLHCIARFEDRGKLDFVIANLSRSEDFASGAALAALSVLDPLATIDRLVEIDDAERSLTRNNWLPALLRAQPTLTRQRIRELAEADPKGRRLIEDLLGERPDQIDEAMLRFVLRMLERDLQKHLDEAVIGDPIWLHHPLDFLGRIARPELLEILQAEAGGELERMIAVVGCSRLRTNSNYRDHVRESARRLLILIGGDGITKLIQRELESGHFWVRHGGLSWAFVRTDDGVVERLATIGRRPVPRDAKGGLESDPYREFYDATIGLAGLGADAALVEIVGQSGVSEVPVDLAMLRAHQGPMAKELTAEALQILQSAASSEQALLIALVIAWMSADADLVPTVRAVLERADPQGRVASYACMALRVLGDCSDEFMKLAERLLHTKTNSTEALNALLGLGNRGLTLLGAWLEGREAAELTDLDDLIIRELYENTGTKTIAVKAAADRCMRGRVLLDGPYDIAAEVEDAALREQIFDKAFAARSMMARQPLRAIEGLAKFDAARALEAIELALRSQPSIERELCRLFVRIAPEAAAEKLVNAALAIERESLHRSIGRALRRLDPESVSSLFVERLKGSVSDRKVLIELARYLPIPAISAALGQLADQDRASEVRHAALIALEGHQRESNVQALLGAFPSAPRDRQWSLLVAILEAGDPYLLTDREDPLWLGRILSDDVPGVFARHADAVLRQRRQKEK